MYPLVAGRELGRNSTTRDMPRSRSVPRVSQPKKYRCSEAQNLTSKQQKHVPPGRGVSPSVGRSKGDPRPVPPAGVIRAVSEVQNVRGSALTSGRESPLSLAAPPKEATAGGRKAWVRFPSQSSPSKSAAIWTEKREPLSVPPAPSTEEATVAAGSGSLPATSGTSVAGIADRPAEGGLPEAVCADRGSPVQRSESVAAWSAGL